MTTHQTMRNLHPTTLSSLVSYSQQLNQPNSSLNLYHFPMALPRGLINSRKFVTYNRDEVTQAKRQPLETRSDGLGAYLTPQQVGAVVLFLVENLTTPVDRCVGRSCRRKNGSFVMGGRMHVGRHRLAPGSGDIEKA